MTRAAALLALLVASACTSSHGVGDGSCEGSAPTCHVSPAPAFGSCCGPTQRDALCVDGSWQCDAGYVFASECAAITPSGYCDGPPPADASVSPLDAGWTAADAGTPDCEGLGAAACFAALDCAPIFDDSCCPSCSEGPCADCFHPRYVGCIPFDGCRAPSCGVVPSWGCLPSAPDCSSATPVALDSCSAYGCVPSYPPGEGDPSLADAACVPITGDSCTVGCRRIAPTCPSGTVPEGDGSCYTDRCIPAFVCE
jgi:hypothetical protein